MIDYDEAKRIVRGFEMNLESELWTDRQCESLEKRAEAVIEALDESRAQLDRLARALVKVGGIDTQDLAFGRWWHECRTCKQGFSSSKYVPNLDSFQHGDECAAQFAIKHVAALEDGT